MRLAYDRLFQNIGESSFGYMKERKIAAECVASGEHIEKSAWVLPGDSQNAWEVVFPRPCMSPLDAGGSREMTEPIDQ